ncbi:MAG: hypothetical protein HY700_12790 [Gemmatimonadetes bacterium]|nr:hypothetical protein [Gemmatimonadota bacterium]
MGNAVLITLRIVHILAGAFWVGAILFVARFLMPTLRAVGPQGTPVMDQLVRVRRMPLAMMGAAIVNILSGLALMWQVSAGFQPAWMRSGPGSVFSMGGGLAILAVILGMSINLPASKRLGAITAALQARGGAPTGDETAQLQRLQARIGATTMTVALLVVLATAAMAAARYVS